MKSIRPLALVALLSTLAGSATAQPDPAPPPPAYGEPEAAPVPAEPAAAPSAPPEPEPVAAPEEELPTYEPVVPAGARRHDGFYFRGALGIGAFDVDRETEGELYENRSSESSIVGGGAMFELSFGGTPMPGLVIAGTLLIHQNPDPTLDYEGGGERDLPGPLSLIVLGPTLDWYPNPEGGFHFGGTLGIGGLVTETEEGSEFEHLGGVGGALSVMAGYDFWVADEWSIGVLGRLTGARVHGEDESNRGLKGSEDSTATAVAIAFSVLHH